MKMYQEHIARYMFAAQAGKGRSVLDIGCGVGYGAQLIARSGATKVVGFDVSESAIEHAKQFYTHPNVEFQTASAEDFTYSERFDLITCFELIEHVENQHAVLQRISAALADNGLLFISTPRKTSGQRSAFHKRELAFFEFSNLLGCYFPQVRFFVENNHFASLVTDGRTQEINPLYSINSQFSPGQADYFVAIACAESVRPPELRSQLVLNDDAYVRNLERDVNILHRAEDTLQHRVGDLTQNLKAAEARLSRVSETCELLNRERDGLATDLANERLTDESHRRRISDLGLQLKASDERCQSVLETIAVLERQREGLLTELAGEQGILQIARAEHLDARRLAEQTEQARRQEIGNLSMELRSTHESCRSLAARIEVLEGEEERLLAALALERDTAQLALAERTRLENDKRKLDRESAEYDHQATTQRAEWFEVESRRLHQHLDELERALGDSKRELAETNAWRSTQQQDLAVLRQRSGDDRLVIADLRKQIQELRRSWSWRLMHPVRRLADSVHGFRRLFNGATRDSRPALVYAGETSGTQEGSGPGPQAPTASDEHTGSVPELALASSDLFEGRRTFDVVYVIGCHEGASKRYRVHNLVESLRELGYSAIGILDCDIGAMVERKIVCGTLVLFRCAWDERVEMALNYCRANGIRSFFDIDDLVFDPAMIGFVHVVSTFSENEKENYRNGVRRYRKTLLESDSATCTTRFLASRIEQAGKPAAVIPNSLNDRQIEVAGGIPVRPPDGTVRIGYFSGSNTHQIDFQQCEDALLRVMSTYAQVRFVLVGILDLSHRWDEYAVRVERHPLLPSDEMLTILAGVEINLAPLELGNPYCEGKSQLKIFEAGLVGVPTVASATHGYSEAIDHGIDGLLATDAHQWFESIGQLVVSHPLRNRLGEHARERALRQFGPLPIGRIAAAVYGLGKPPDSPDNMPDQPGPSRLSVPPFSTASSRSPEIAKLKITWIIPGLIIGGGGHRNILRAAFHLQQFGHEIDLYFTNTELTEAQLQTAVADHFYPLRCPMFRYQGSIRRTDVIFATHWSTVDAAVRNRASARELMYFVQDFEPAFAPMGTEYILAENTYRLGLYHITSGPWCEDFLRNQFQADADHFKFPVDMSVYNERPRTVREKNILFFAKPEMPRRCYELGILALEEFHRARPDVQIILFGSRNVDPGSLPFKCTVRAVVPTIQDLASMYANADLGIVFSTTNPSLVPYEMMACGLPVVDLGRPGNEINYGNRRDIAWLADPMPTVMARQVAELMDNPAERSARSRRGLEFVQTFPSEEGMARTVEALILKRMARVEAKETAA